MFIIINIFVNLNYPLLGFWPNIPKLLFWETQAVGYGKAMEFNTISMEICRFLIKSRNFKIDTSAIFLPICFNII